VFNYDAIRRGEEETFVIEIAFFSVVIAIHPKNDVVTIISAHITAGVLHPIFIVIAYEESYFSLITLPKFQNHSHRNDENKEF
jgi:hypothetical protein